MKLLEVALLISGVVWCISVVYLIYGIGLSLLTLSIEPAITAIILFIFATGAEFLLAILND